MPAKPSDPYVPFNEQARAVPDVEMPHRDEFSVRANPEEMGAQVGAALQKTGQEGEKVGNEAISLATKYAEQATQARADDIIANQLVPATSKISTDYLNLKGKAAIDNYDSTMQGLQNVRSTLTQDLPPALANLVNGFAIRHITNLQDGVMRHQNQQMDSYEKDSAESFISSQGDIAVSAGSDISTVNQAIKTATARRTLYDVQNQNIDPNDANSQNVLNENTKAVVGQITGNVVKSSLQRGDIFFANQVYQQNKNNIGGQDQLKIDSMLHSENMRHFGDDAANAIIKGQPIPHSPSDGADVTNVKSVISSAAVTSGVDPNSSLMIAKIESSFGQNVGSRGDIGQTGKPAATVDEQAKNLVEAQKTAQAAADQAVGGKAAPWQMYTVYQQGVGGGVALLKPENANTKAVDVLTPFYGSSQKALTAISGNGGNASMTAGQFTDFLRQKCEQAYGAVKCDTVGNQDLGTAIAKPHQETGITLQMSDNPVKNFQQFDSLYPSMLERANSIPNIDERESTLRSLEEKHKLFQASATAWKTKFSGQIQDIVTKPDFVSMSDSRITPEIRTAMADDPAMLTMARNMAKANLEESLGKDTGKLGSAYWDTFKKINSGQITNISQLNEMAGSGLTREGLTQARKDLESMNTPDGAGEAKLRDQTFKAVRSMIMGKNDSFNVPDPEGEETYGHAMALMYQAEAKGRAEKLTDMYDPSSKNWIGNVAKPLVKPIDQRIAEMGKTDILKDKDVLPPIKERVEGKVYNLPAGNLVWTSNGWARYSPPQVPMAK